jgi:hypothetical protein
MSHEREEVALFLEVPLQNLLRVVLGCNVNENTEHRYYRAVFVKLWAMMVYPMRYSPRLLETGLKYLRFSCADNGSEGVSDRVEKRSGMAVVVFDVSADKPI